MDLLTVFARFPDQQACLTHLEVTRWGDDPTAHIAALCTSPASVTVPGLAAGTATLAGPASTCWPRRSSPVPASPCRSGFWLSRWWSTPEVTVVSPVSPRPQLDPTDGLVSLAPYPPRNGEPAEPPLVTRDCRSRRDLCRREATPQQQAPCSRSADTWARYTQEAGGRCCRASRPLRLFAPPNLSGDTVTKIMSYTLDARDSLLITDEYSSYKVLDSWLDHEVVAHGQQYADGEVHTNTIESAWAVLKRAHHGSHHHYSRKWLPLYLAEAGLEMERTVY